LDSIDYSYLEEGIAFVLKQKPEHYDLGYFDKVYEKYPVEKERALLDNFAKPWLPI
jgi:hypothetical protein